MIGSKSIHYYSSVFDINNMFEYGCGSFFDRVRESGHQRVSRGSMVVSGSFLWQWFLSFLKAFETRMKYPRNPLKSLESFLNYPGIFWTHQNNLKLFKNLQDLLLTSLKLSWNQLKSSKISSNPIWSSLEPFCTSWMPLKFTESPFQIPWNPLKVESFLNSLKLPWNPLKHSESLWNPAKNLHETPRNLNKPTLKMLKPRMKHHGTFFVNS